MLAEAINTLNEKGFKYKAETEGGSGIVTMKFGLMAAGEKTAVSITPTDEKITVDALGATKDFDVAGLAGFLDKVVELKALQKQEASLVKEIKEM